MKHLGFSLFLYTITVSAYSYNPDQATTNFASELSACSAFYTLMSTQVARQENIELSAELEQSAVYAYTLAVELSNAEVTAARMELEANAMIVRIDNNASNSAILMNEYLHPCKSTLEDPESRFQFWLDK